MERFQNEENDKRIESKYISYQHKDKKNKQFKIKNSSSSEVYGDPHKKNYQYTSDSSEDNYHTRKINFKPYEEISGEFKKTSHQPLMVKLRMEQRQNHGCPG